MDAPECRPNDYIDFLVARPCMVSGTEAARMQPDQAHPSAHDAFTRPLHRLEPDPATLWAEAAPQIQRPQWASWCLTTAPWTSPTRARSACWRAIHRRVVQGINLLTPLWTDGEALIPRDDRLCEKAVDQLSKNDHFRWRRARRGAGGQGAAQPHRLRHPRLPAPRTAPPRHRRQLVGGQNQHHPRGDPAIPVPAALHPRLHGGADCVNLEFFRIHHNVLYRYPLPLLPDRHRTAMMYVHYACRAV